jgi:glycosyltransferase involved in cell wall biosynthesis
MYSHIILLTRGEITGGASVFALDICELLIEKGFSPLLVHGCDSLSVGSYCKANDIKHLSLPSLSNKISIVQDYSCFLALHKLVSSNPEAVIVLNSAKAAFVCRFVCTVLSRKCFYVVHGWPYIGWKRQPSRLIYYLVELFAETFFALQTHFVYVSSYDKKNRPFSAFNLIHRERGLVIHNSVSRKSINLLGLQPRIQKSPFLNVVTICRLDRQKDVASLIRAVSLLPQVTLRVIGTGPQKEELISLAADLKSLDRITFVGALPRCDVIYQLLRSDVFALISHWEGFPISTVEAMSCALPIIVSDVGGAAEVFDLAPTLRFGYRIRAGNRVSEVVQALREYFDEKTLQEHSRNSFYAYSRSLSRPQFESKYLALLTNSCHL